CLFPFSPLILPPPPRSPPLPYTTLFRSHRARLHRLGPLHPARRRRPRVRLGVLPGHDPERSAVLGTSRPRLRTRLPGQHDRSRRSEEHTSELQSRFDIVCRLLPEKTKTT